jgi:WhiB family redox-sensing transcriptional regulator
MSIGITSISSSDHEWFVTASGSTAAWRSHGACGGLDPAIFFPDEEDENQVQEAKAICAECSVRLTCLEYALAAREKMGVWGGATERERRRIIRQRRRSA